MAVTTDGKESAPVSRHGLALTGAYLVGLGLVFVGQRLVGEPGLGRTLLGGLGVAISGGALTVRLLGRTRMASAAARVETIAAALYGAGLVAMGLYWLTTSNGLEMLGIRETAAGDHLSAILGALWIALMVCSLFALLFVELSYATMPIAGAVEIKRVHTSAAAGLTLALALIYLMAFNFTATEFEVRRDLSYFKEATPSEATVRMVERLDEPIEVVLFYPQSNEVLERVRPYFEELQRHTDNVQLRVVDHVLAPRLTKEHRVRRNGTVLITRGEQGESFPVGLELEKARSRLKRLDKNFQVRFSTVSQPPMILYTTVGHGERITRHLDEAGRGGIYKLTQLVRRFGLRHRNLGLAQGLASHVPEDAAVVAVVGPTQTFLPEEVESLVRYARGGGRLLLTLEPGEPAGLEPLLEELGLELGEGTLTHEQLYRLLTDTTADRAAIISNRYSSHPAVTTVTRATKGVATVFYHAGHLSKRRDLDQQRINFIIRSISGTWADLDGDLTYDPGEEHRMTYSMAAAVTLPEAGDDDDGNEAGEDDEDEGRAVVIADADVFSDRVIGNEGNHQLAADVITWLSGYEGGAGQIELDDDPAIEHTRGQDALWFWSTVVLIPAAVLLFGLIFTARRKARPGRSS